MKISPYDRCKATWRSKFYQDDFEKYLAEYSEEQDEQIEPESATGSGPFFSSRLSDAGKKLCRKWRLNYPLHGDISKDGPDIYYDLVMDGPIQYLEPPEKWKKSEGMPTGKREDDVKLCKVDDKLVLMIDTSSDYSYQEIEDAFKAFIRVWVKPSKERSTNPEIDIWEAYDTHEKQNKTYEAIAKKFFSNDDLFDDSSKTYDLKIDQLEAYRIKISRAVQKAKNIIAEIEKQARAKNH